MSLLDLLNQAQGGRGLADLGRAFGLDPAMTEALAAQIAPAISGGVKRKAAEEGGLGVVLGQLQGQGQAGYYDAPTVAAAPEARVAGEDFLSQLFGDRQAAPELARAAAVKTGAPPEKAEAFTPALAAMLQGGMQRAAPDEEIDAAIGGMEVAGGDRAGAGLGDLLGALGGASSGEGGALGGIMAALTGGGGRAGAAPGGGLGQLLQMLDADGDGSPLDDVIGRFLK
ncbi:DUF937 domain-containing protein [Pikeienuella piscinae]|uniref:DUF937 domain-containing protein n=1 Tax=Pikeienuella piscinae TaxID=2748098 RepID=A0A7L5BWU6_9RHOB|nr:DUF937 domain-containing protein [Pikeienuella piscinae]QIE54716.1 DUF937 domain-containing protein [Pikeienuella piscinae]